LNVSRNSRVALLATSKPSTKNRGWVPAKITIGYYELIARSQLPYEQKGFPSEREHCN
jgi:hypothetical protein